MLATGSKHQTTIYDAIENTSNNKQTNQQASNKHKQQTTNKSQTSNNPLTTAATTTNSNNNDLLLSCESTAAGASQVHTMGLAALPREDEAMSEPAAHDGGTAGECYVHHVVRVHLYACDAQQQQQQQQ